VEDHRLRLHRLLRILVNDASSSINSHPSLGLRGRRAVIINLSSASLSPPLLYQQSTLTTTTTNQHMRSHSRSFSGTLSSSHVPYRVSFSGAGRVDERSSDQEEEEREEEEEEEEEQVVRAGGGGTLPIHINASSRHNFEEDTHYADDRVRDHRHRYRRSIPVRLPNRRLHHLACRHHRPLRQHPTMYRTQA